MCGKKNTIEIWDTRAGKQISQFTYEQTAADCNLSPDGKHLLLITKPANQPDHKGDVRLELWDAITGKLKGEFKGHSGPVWEVHFSPDGSTLATWGTNDKTVRIWDVATQRERHRFQTPNVAFLQLNFTKDGKTVGAAGMYTLPQRWDLATGKELPAIQGTRLEEMFKDTCFAFKLLPDGRTFLTADKHGNVFAWDVATGELLREWKAHQFRVSLLQVSDDGKTLLTRGATTALVWDLAALLRRKP